MQTFLPYESFARSASVLDRYRLGKQRVENLQIMRALIDPSAGWQNHPAVKMWRGYGCALMLYQHAICTEWVSRGYKDTCLFKTDAIHDLELSHRLEMPPWLGDPDFHRAHQSNLIRKDADYYGPLFPDVPADLDYVWPVS